MNTIERLTLLTVLILFNLLHYDAISNIKSLNDRIVKLEMQYREVLNR